MAVALFTFKGQQKEDLTFGKGEKIEVLKSKPDNKWCYGRCGERKGWLPKNYISFI